MLQWRWKIVIAGVVAGLALSALPVLAVVTLIEGSFKATDASDVVRLGWQTATEYTNAGFYIQRSTLADGPFQRIEVSYMYDGNLVFDELIPSLDPSGGEGALYVVSDTQVTAGTTYYYRLEDIDSRTNQSGFHGPISVTFGTLPTPTPLASATPSPTTTSLPGAPTSTPLPSPVHPLTFTPTPTGGTPSATPGPGTPTATPVPETSTPTPTGGTPSATPGPGTPTATPVPETSTPTLTAAVLTATPMLGTPTPPPPVSTPSAVATSVPLPQATLSPQSGDLALPATSTPTQVDVTRTAQPASTVVPAAPSTSPIVTPTTSPDARPSLPSPAATGVTPQAGLVLIKTLTPSAFELTAHAPRPTSTPAPSPSAGGGCWPAVGLSAFVLGIVWLQKRR